MEVGYQAVAQAKETWSGSVEGDGSQGLKASFDHPIRTREVVRSCQSVGTCQQPKSSLGRVSRNQSDLGEIVCENPSVIERKTTCAKAAAYSSNRLSGGEFDQGLLKKDAHAMGTPSYNPPLVNLRSYKVGQVTSYRRRSHVLIQRQNETFHPDARYCVQCAEILVACFGTPCNGEYYALCGLDDASENLRPQSRDCTGL